MYKEKATTRVYHAADPWVCRWPWDYRLVAEVATADREEAFRLTNDNGEDEHWTERDGVRTHIDPCRSTSVGDVVVTPDGNAHRCERHGWSRPSDAQAPPGTPD